MDVCAVCIVDIFWTKEYFKYVFTTAITYLGIGIIIIEIQIFLWLFSHDILDCEFTVQLFDPQVSKFFSPINITLFWSILHLS